ncbi:hypothetical protein LXM25_04915 [Dyadobacter sp. LJ53]|uniref:hypothetical protein n=1 Tax=Dyadobacter chenwenxiniae TaxID=2906456 RepID=UPI001F2DCDA9|nr:hypothetical protein [Dyadobacter chenwenxiniae]MCF0049386.1 hypothetical protein [Dyadobacter chenwenxiniae]
MNLVQKLPIGLGLACLMFMSSCSKEEAQMPEPKVEAATADTTANMKTGPYAWICGTKGYPGINTLPNFWEKRWLESGEASKYPSGTSSFERLWGNNALEWKGPFPGLPNVPWNSIVTVTTSTNDKSKFSKLSKVGTTIRFLKPGAFYNLTFYVASARPEKDPAGKNPSFVHYCNIAIKSPNTGEAWQTKYFDVNMLEAAPHTWIKKTVLFQATREEMRFDFSATSINEGMTAYAHLFIGQDAIAEKKMY